MSDKIFERIQTAILENIGLSNEVCNKLKDIIPDISYVPISCFDLNLKNYNDERYNIVYSRYLSFLIKLRDQQLKGFFDIDTKNKKVRINEVIVPKNKYASLIIDPTIPPNVLKMLNIRLSVSDDTFKEYYQISDTYNELNIQQKAELYKFFMRSEQYTIDEIDKVINTVQSSMDINDMQKLSIPDSDIEIMKNIIGVLNNFKAPYLNTLGFDTNTDIYDLYKDVFDDSNFKSTYNLSTFIPNDLTEDSLYKIAYVFKLSDDAVQNMISGMQTLMDIINSSPEFTIKTPKFEYMIRRIQDFKQGAISDKLYDPYLFELFDSLKISFNQYDSYIKGLDDTSILNFMYSVTKLVEFVYKKLNLYFIKKSSIRDFNAITNDQDFFMGQKVRFVLKVLTVLKQLYNNVDPNIIATNPGIMLACSSGDFNLKETTGVIQETMCGIGGTMMNKNGGLTNDSFFIDGITTNEYTNLLQEYPVILKYFATCYYVFAKFNYEGIKYFSEIDKCPKDNITEFCFYPRLINNDLTLAEFVQMIKNNLPTNKLGLCQSAINSFANIPTSYELGMSKEGIRMLLFNLDKLKQVPNKTDKEKYINIIAWFVYCMEKYSSKDQYEVNFQSNNEIDLLYQKLKELLNISKRFNKEEYYRKYELNKYFTGEILNKLFNFISFYIKRTGGEIKDSNIFDLNIQEENYKFQSQLQELYDNNKFNSENIAKIVPNYAIVQYDIFDSINKNFGGHLMTDDIGRLFNESIKSCENVPYNDEAAFEKYVCERVQLFREGFNDNEFMTSKNISHLINPFGNARDNVLNSIRNDKIKIQAIGNVNSSELFQRYFSDIFYNMALIKNRSFNIPDQMKCYYKEMVIHMFKFLIFSYVGAIYTNTYNSFTKLFENSGKLIDPNNTETSIIIDRNTVDQVITPAIESNINRVKKNLVQSVKDILAKMNTLKNYDNQEVYSKEEVDDILRFIQEVSVY